MLSHDDEADAVGKLINSFPCRVELPPQWKENFERQGPVVDAEEHRRRFPRVYCRGERNRAGLQYQSTLPSLHRDSSWHNVYLDNVSRSGIGFLHYEPLYPHEQMRMLLPTGRTLNIEIVSCRRIHNCCFFIGAHIINGSALSATAENDLAKPTTSDAK